MQQKAFWLYEQEALHPPHERVQRPGAYLRRWRQWTRSGGMDGHFKQVDSTCYAARMTHQGLKPKLGWSFHFMLYSPIKNRDMLVWPLTPRGMSKLECHYHCENTGDNSPTTDILP